MRLFVGIIILSCVTCALAQSGDSNSTAPAPTASTKPGSDGQNQQPPASSPSDAAEGQSNPGSQSQQSAANPQNGSQNSPQPSASPTPAPAGAPAAASPSTLAGPSIQAAPPGSSVQPTPAASPTPPAQTSETANPTVKAEQQQPKRILGIMPNYRAVSAGEIPPPPTAKQAFKIATQNSFDYSSFVFVGITSLMAEGTDAHPQLGKGVSGFGRYYWRGFLDKTDGNYLVIFALPTVFHQDERYYAMGEGGFFKRATYSASRILITPDYHGHKSFNFSEVLGRGMAQGISLSYYPSKDRTLSSVAVKYGYAMGRDALTNIFREFWPDIATHVLHRHP